MMEKTLRQSLFMARGNVLEIVGRPLTLTLLILGLAAVVAPLVVSPAARESDQRGAGSTGSLKRSRLPKGSVTSITRAFHGASSMPGRMKR